ncbi:MAG: SpoIID/LytB domain-containing protein [SAR324 cluster bacterium]|nr:SpoIID/LytB domain-containing protein [SAR324 cluster bacterium]
MHRILLLFLFFLLPLQLQAADYANPTLKVLLLSSKGMVKFTSMSGIEVYGAKKPMNPPKVLNLQYLGNSQVQIGNFSKSKKPFFLVSSKPIRIYQGRRSYKYEGEIEIRPYKGGFSVINHIAVESYLEGVLNAEISTKWNFEVVKAQAILARTYAVKKARERRNRSWHLKSDQTDQVYKGVGLSDEIAKEAIDATRGFVVNYRGRLAQIFYHSSCGGTTEDPGNLWKNGYPYYQVKEVPFGREDPNYNWKFFISNAKMRQILNQAGAKGATGIEIYERNGSNRAQEMISTGPVEKVISAKNFRRLVGYTKVKSLLFDISQQGGGFVVEGRGSGHGVGMCQWAGKEMADLGYTYYDILYYFYDGVEIEVYNL